MIELFFELPKFMLVLGLAFIALIFFISAFKIFFADEAAYKCNHRSTSGFLNAIKGTVPTKREGARSHNVVAGLVYDLKHKRVVPQGTLSNEAIENMLR
jgi:cytochrome b